MKNKIRILVELIYVTLICLQEFLVQLIHKEKAEASLMANPGSEVTGEISKDLLADPLIFIRKWIGEVNLLYSLRYIFLIFLV